MTLNDWLDHLIPTFPVAGVTALSFNLYEEENNTWAMECIGTGSFDAQDPDWACDEVFTARDDMFRWQEDAGWEEVLEGKTASLRAYMQNGQHRYKLKQYKGIGIGFVDGDLTIL